MGSGIPVLQHGFIDGFLQTASLGVLQLTIPIPLEAKMKLTCKTRKQFLEFLRPLPQASSGYVDSWFHLQVDDRKYPTIRSRLTAKLWTAVYRLAINLLLKGLSQCAYFYL